MTHRVSCPCPDCRFAVRVELVRALVQVPPEEWAPLMREAIAEAREIVGTRRGDGARRPYGTTDSGGPP